MKKEGYGTLNEASSPETAASEDEDEDDTAADDAVKQQEDDRREATSSNRFCCCLNIDVPKEKREAIVFASRVSVSVMIGSLFSFGTFLEHSIWILTTATTVSWLPSLDTATSLKVATERTIGTILGCFFGIFFGFISLLLVNNDQDEFPLTEYSIILVSILFIVSFTVCYLICLKELRSSYASKLGFLTFTIIFVSFYAKGKSSDTPFWSMGSIGIWRAINIVIGCVVAMLSLLLWPKSTKQLIIEKVEQQMLATGHSASLILNLVYDTISNKKQNTMLPFESCVDEGGGSSTATAAKKALSDDDDDDDVDDIIYKPLVDDAVESYRKALASWKACSSAFPMLKYDPFSFPPSSRAAGDERRALFERHMKIRSYRTFRIEMNLVMIDSMVRSGVGHDHDVINHGLFAAVGDVGKHIQTVLDLRNNTLNERQSMIKIIVENDLDKIRHYIDELRKEIFERPTRRTTLYVSNVQELISNPDPHSNESLLGNLDSLEQMVLLLQLVEHLIIRVTRLHYFCQKLDV